MSRDRYYSELAKEHPCECGCPKYLHAGPDGWYGSVCCNSKCACKEFRPKGIEH